MDIAKLLGGTRLPRQHDYAYQELAERWSDAEATERARIAAEVVAHLRADSVRTRSEVIRFFQSCAADDGGALSRALTEAPELFDAVEDPIAGATGDLRGELGRALVSDPARARSAMEQLRSEVLKHGRGGPLVVGLLRVDAAWVRQHAIQIVQATPATYVSFVVNLALLQQDVVAFVRETRRALSASHAEAVLRERLAKDPSLLEACLSALLEG